jgi:NADH:ubiquinone oxidoreductase subunit F (NADH-binding)
VVVNVSEGEPASLKDLALALTQPHLVLDGASLAAQALGVGTVHVVLPADQPRARAAVERALAERAGLDRAGRVRWEIHLAAARFVSGESSAVIELIGGRPGLPVTSWEPAAVAGVRGRPTLLSNAETFAHVAALALPGAVRYAALGTADEPGTRLLTLAADSGTARVVEVPHGTPWEEVLTVEELSTPILLGGYHGTWVPAGGLRGLSVSRSCLHPRGLTLGAGIVLPLTPAACPLEHTAAVLRYLAGESAGRCGPCFNGLPALATAFEDRVAGLPDSGVDRLAALVEGRGACAHPDGAVRMVRSALRAFPEELLAHARGACLGSPRGREVLR